MCELTKEMNRFILLKTQIMHQNSFFFEKKNYMCVKISTLAFWKKNKCRMFFVVAENPKSPFREEKWLREGLLAVVDYRHLIKHQYSNTLFRTLPFQIFDIMIKYIWLRTFKEDEIKLSSFFMSLWKTGQMIWISQRTRSRLCNGLLSRPWCAYYHSFL